MRFRFVGFLGVLAASAAGLHAADTDTTSDLEKARQDVQQLRKELRSKNVVEGKSPVVDAPAPALELQPSAGSAEQWAADKQKARRFLEQNGRRTSTEGGWLLEGMEKLENTKPASPHPNGSSPEPGKASAETVESRAALTIDLKDPQYLLKAFSAQKKESEAKSAIKALSSPAPADPLGPFMDNWLGSSPVRGQFFDQFVKREGADVAAPAITAAPGSELDVATTPPSFLPSPSRTPGNATSNPYLVDLTPPVPGHDHSAVAIPPEIPPVALPAPELPRVAAPEAAPPPSDLRTPLKSPLPSPTDEKKYFPQLKRF